MKSALRTFVAIFAGLFLALALIVAVELFGAVVHPLPEGFEGTTEEMCRHVERFPAWVLAVVVPLWAFAAFVSAWSAQRIGNLFSSAVVGLLLLAALILNMSMLPYPIWFEIANLLAVPIAVIIGIRAAMGRKTAVN